MPPLSFNSNLVRLKPRVFEVITIDEALFQFQSGTIKATDLSDANDAPILFQFQSGTIKAAGRKFIAGYRFVFQFQSGTIKAIRPTRARRRGACFNSNLVRLKPYTPG